MRQFGPLAVPTWPTTRLNSCALLPREFFRVFTTDLGGVAGPLSEESLWPTLGRRPRSGATD